MDSITLAAIAGAAVPGVAALVLAVILWVRVRRTRAAQRMLLGDGEPANLVDGQAALLDQARALRTDLTDLHALVDRQSQHVASELSTVIRFQGLVRYDAYRDMGGSQSWSLALLDQTAAGTVISCLHARDHARMYVKEIHEGVSSQRLSPEEERAIALALRGGRPGADGAV